MVLQLIDATDRYPPGFPLKPTRMVEQGELDRLESGENITMSKETKSTEPLAAQWPATAYPGMLEPYTPQRIAEFLLNNAIGPEDYAAAVAEVRKLGIDPSTIPHEVPEGI